MTGSFSHSMTSPEGSICCRYRRLEPAKTGLRTVCPVLLSGMLLTTLFPGGVAAGPPGPSGGQSPFLFFLNSSV